MEQYTKKQLSINYRKPTRERVRIKSVDINGRTAHYALIFTHHGRDSGLSNYTLFDICNNPIGSYVGSVNESMILEYLKD